MSDHSSWLSGAQVGRLKSLLPDKVRGVPRVDDRRVIFGIVHVLKSEGRWIDAPSEYGPREALDDRSVRWAEKETWRDIFDALADAGGPPSQALIDSSAVRAHRSAAGGKWVRKHRPIGRSRGGRTMKTHAIADRLCRPIRTILTSGHAPDCVVAEALLEILPSQVDVVQGDKGYDTNAVRSQIETARAAPNTPPKSNRRCKPSLSSAHYRRRDAVVRMFGRLKDSVGLALASTGGRTSTSRLSASPPPSGTGYESGA